MTILFHGSTTAELGGVRQTSNGTMDTAYTTEAVFHPYGQPIQWDFFKTPDPTATVVWTHFDIRVGFDAARTTADGHYMTWLDSSNRAIARLDVDNGSVYMRAYGGAQVTTASLNLSNNTRYVFDIKIERDAGGVGLQVSFYVNGSLIGTATTTVGSAELPSYILCDNNDISGNGGDGTRYSQVIVREGFSTIGLKLARLEPDADGNYTDWSNGFAELQNMDDTLSSGAATDKESFTVGNYGGAAPTEVIGVFLNAYVLPPETGPNALGGFVRIGGTDYAGTDVTIPEPTNAVYEWLTNPATGLEWTTTEINALEAGVEAKVI